jgi:uncharacterized membrane protein YhaH (DUF805 family)
MDSNGTQIGLTLGGLAVFGTLYALTVRHLAAKGVHGQTAYLVTFGVLVTVVGASGLIGLVNAALLLGCFAASGTPMIVEYVIRTHQRQQADRDKAAQIARELLK